MNLGDRLTTLEQELNQFSPEKRKHALMEVIDLGTDAREVRTTQEGSINLHAHTFFSYNSYGYSPTALAWMAKKKGLEYIGIVDFDVIDGVDEFLDACELLKIKGVAGMETRVFIPEYRKVEINSPGEPGVAYHMGTGFTSSSLTEEVQPEFDSLRARAADRNAEIIQNLNTFLKPLTLDFESEVVPLSPRGNVTERHIVKKLIDKSFLVLEDVEQFWQEKLDLEPAQVESLFKDRIRFEGLIRKQLIKRGGVAYVTPDPDKFPTINKFNHIVQSLGAIPCLAWLDGTSEGEHDIESLLGFMIETGVRAVNIIPDRNWDIADPDIKKEKLEELFKFVEIADSHQLPILIGTEMNKNGQKFVDNLDIPELSHLKDKFIKGAQFIYGHTRLERSFGLGFQSAWATENLPDQGQKLAFYSEAGKLMAPGAIDENLFDGFSDDYSPEKIISILRDRRQ